MPELIQHVFILNGRSCHTGAHKINNNGQILLAKMGKNCGTGAGQHGAATATVCAMFDLVYLYGTS